MVPAPTRPGYPEAISLPERVRSGDPCFAACVIGSLEARSVRQSWPDIASLSTRFGVP